jgi:TRAP-type C4-dicarboxylate transport system permease small subunit
MDSIFRKLHKIEDLCMMIPLAIIIAVTIINVFLRYIFLSGFLWMEELMGLNMLLMGMSGVAVCIREKEHTSMDSLACSLRPSFQKILYFFVNLLVLFILLVCTYSGFLFLLTVKKQVSPILRWPMQLFYGVIVFGFVLCVIEHIRVCAKEIKSGECRFVSIEEQILNQDSVLKVENENG